MKQRLHRTLIIASLILLSAGTAIAQQPQNRSPSEMEDSFVRLMRFSAADASSETRTLHLRALGKAYDKYMAAVDNELKVLRDLLDAAGSIAPDMRDEISKTIKRWEEKQARAKKDFQEFASSVNSASSAVAASSASSSADLSASSSSGAANPLPTPAVPASAFISVPENPGLSDVVGMGLQIASASSGAAPTTNGHNANVPLVGLAGLSEGDDARENFEATGYIGVGVDSFAAGDIKKVLNPGNASGRKERFVGGFDFAYRLFGDPGSRENGKWKSKNQQLWFYGGTIHGVRSADVDCSANSDVCKDVFDVTSTPQRFSYILRNASSLEGYMGVRWEFAQLNKSLVSTARAYLKAQAGFLTVRDGIDDVYDVHHIAAGLIATKDRFKNSYLEVGFGRTDLFTENRRRRFKIDGFLSWEIPIAKLEKRFRPFARINIDTDMRRGSDSVQSYFGFDFDLRCIFASATCK